MTPEPITIPPDVQAMMSSASNHAALVKRVVTTSEDYLQANNELASIKILEKNLKEKRDWLLEPSKTAFAEQKKRLDSIFEPKLKELAEAKLVWDAAIIGYKREQQRLADEENRRRQAEVEKEKQKLREQAAAEQARADKIAVEKRRKAEEEEAAGRVAAAARLREQAQAKETETASRIAVLETTAATMSAAPVEVNVPKSDAGHGRKTHWAELAKPEELTNEERAFAVTEGTNRTPTPFEILVCAVAGGIMNGTHYPSIALLKLNESVLNKQGSALKENFRIPGCRHRWKETTVSARAK